MESFHYSGRNRLTGVQLMTRIQKRFCQSYGAETEETPALNKSSIGRDYLKSCKWSEELPTLHMRESPWSVLEVNAQDCDKTRCSHLLVSSKDDTCGVKVGAHSRGPSRSPSAPSRGMSHICQNFKVWRQDNPDTAFSFFSHNPNT